MVAADEPSDAVIAAYIDAIAASDDIIAGNRRDSPATSPEPGWEQAGLAFPDLRSVLVHVIVETSVHAGRLDLVRGLLDGRQHIVH